MSHGIGAIFALIATPILIVTAVNAGGVYSIVGSSVFAASMIILYLSSTLYHALPNKRAKGVFQIVDHIAIFLFIAGIYTPFALGVLRGAWGWAIFGLVWSIALAGIVMKLVFGVKYPKISTAIYLGTVFHFIAVLGYST